MTTALEPPSTEPLAPLRVALEVRSLDRGGLESVVAELARGLPAHGVEPLVVCTERGGAQADRLRRDGVHVEVLTGDDRRAELDAILERHDVRLLSAHYSTLGTPLAAARGLPVVVTLHNAYAWLGAAIFDEIRALDPQVTCYVAVSASVAGFCARRFRIEPRRIAVVRNGARMARLAATAAERARLRGELGVDASAELVVQVGSVSRVKCQLALVDAIAALRDSRPRLVAWIVGSEMEADYAELVRRRIAAVGLERRVVLTGARDDVDRVLAAADVFALPSVIEGLSLAAIEALQAGVPAVLTRTGDAAFLLGAAADGGAEHGGAGARVGGATLPGALVDGPSIDPQAIDWMSLRELAGAEHPPHAAHLARALAEVLDDLDARRAAAVARSAELATVLTPEAMCRNTASVLLRVAAGAAVARARRLEAERERAERSADELRGAVERVSQELPAVAEATAELRDRLARVEAELATTVRQSLEMQGRTLDLQGRTLEIATRTLDKLRLKNRVSKAFAAFAARLGIGAGGGSGEQGRGVSGAGAGRGRRARRRAGAGETSSSERASTPHGAAAKASSGPRPTHWLILAVVPFDDIGGAQRSAQLARALAKRGERVTYAARFPRSESVDLGLCADVPGLQVIEWDADALREWLRACDERVRVLVEVPDEQALAIARFARRHGARVVYDKVDAWEACTWAAWFRPEVERQLVADADDLVASAKLLQRGLAGAAGDRQVHLVPNAVDRALFSPARAAGAPLPPDLERGEVTLVYAGSLWGDWFDWDIVAGVARARPTWRIALVGDPPHPAPPALPENVRFLGLKPQAALPAYYRAADACLIPFARGPVVDAVNPLKVYEYLAMHRPVVATPMPELRALPHVFVASDAPETVAAVERAVATPPPVAEIETFLAGNTWEARASSLIGLAARPTIAVIVLCYDNRDVIGQCVSSLVRFRGALDYRIAVVDNGSTDGSLEVLAEHERRGEIALVRNSRNGCSSGRNLGLEHTASEIVVFLDSDQWATGEGWLEPALEILRERREIGAVAWNAGWFEPGSGRGPIVDYLPERGMTGRHAGAPYRTDVAYLATSGFVAPRAVLARTKGFDEFYDPTCFEDTDLSFQIKAAGYELAYCPRLGLGHRPHRTTGSLDGYGGVLARNERYFLDKWRARPEFFFGVPDAPA